METIDIRLLKYLFAEYVDCKSLLCLSMTSTWLNEIINGKGGVCDELLFRISPLLTNHRRTQEEVSILPRAPSFHSKLHAITFYEDIRLAKRQFMVSCGEDHTVIAVHSNQVLAFGSNQSGQLGIGTEEDHVEPVEVLIPDLDYIQHRCSVQSVVGGANHTIVLLNNGKIYGFGDNSFGQLGPQLPLENMLTPADIQFPTNEKVSMISCAKNYTAIVLDDVSGTVIILGMGLNVETTKFKGTNFRQLSRGQIKPSEKISDVSAGYHHLLLLTTSGKAYAVGSNRFGQLGTAQSSLSLPMSTQPVFVQFDNMSNPVAQVAAGEKHSMLLTRDGNLYTWGNGSKGQLGNGSFQSEVFTPTEIKLPGKSFPIIITCGNDHSVVLDIDGNVLTCGINSFGQTATRSTFFAVNRFAVVNSGEFSDEAVRFRKLVHIAAGNTHTAVLGHSSKLFMFGQTDKCGGGGFIRQHNHKTVPVQVDLLGSIDIHDPTENKFFTATYMRR